MALAPPRRFALATTGTALVAFLLVVPTVLHLADPAFGLGTGSNGGYGPPPAVPATFDQRPPPAPTPAPTATTTTSSSTTTASSPTPTATTPASTTPASTTPASTTPAATPTTETTPTPAATTPASPTPSDSTTTSSPETAPTTASPSPTPQTTPASPTPASPTPAGPTPASPTPETGITLNSILTPVLDTVTGSVSTSASIDASQIVADVPVTIPINTQSASENAPVLPTPAPTATDAEHQAYVTSLLTQPVVSGITITPKTGGVAATVTVKEILPTDAAAQTIIPQSPNTNSGSVVLKVAGTAANAATGAAATESVDYHVLKVIQIDSSVNGADLASASIQMHVTQEQLDALGLAPNSVTVLHFDNGKWVSLPTNLVPGTTYTFRADTPHFSYFALAAAQPPAEVSASGMSALGMTALVLAAIAVVVIVGAIIVRRRQQ